MVGILILSVAIEMYTNIAPKTQHTTAYIFNMLTYFLSPIIAYLWTLYVYMVVNTQKPKLKIFAIFTSMPIVLNTFLILTNPITHVYFRLSNDMVFSRGPFYFILLSVCLTYIAGSLYLSLKYRYVKSTFTTRNLVLFSLLPIVGALLQTIFYGSFFLYIWVTVGALIIYLNIQNNVLDNDFLTAALNRRALQNRLSDKIESRSDGDFCAMMIDIDKFKSINDTYGHLAGDEALKKSVMILKKVFPRKSYIGRYGGDEFVILCDEVYDLIALNKRLKKELDSFNKSSKQYTLSFSVGYSVYDKASNMSDDDFLDILDSKMYETKNKKNLKRRSND